MYPNVEDLPKPADGEDLAGYMKRCPPDLKGWILATIFLVLVFAAAREKVAESSR